MDASLPSAQPERTPVHRQRALLLVALAFGLCGALWFQNFWLFLNLSAGSRLNALGSGTLNGIVLIASIGIGSIPPVNRILARLLDRLRDPTPEQRRIASIAIAIGAATTFYGLAYVQGRSFVPFWHDSNMHMVQAQLIAHGKLWAGPHPLADQMETFHVFTKPVYAAIHFPGTSMLYAPFLMLGIGPGVYSSLIAGAIVGLCYRVLTEIVDGVAAALSVPLLLAVSQLRLLSAMLMSHHVVLVPILLAVWAYLHWRKRPAGDLRWAAAIGAFLGFAAITRPVEAIAYALGLAIAMAIGLRGAPARRWISTICTVTVMGMPFVALQLEFNRHVTGSWLLPPYEHYNHLYHPGLAYGGGLEQGSALHISTNLPQKYDYYDDFIVRLSQRTAGRGPLDVLVTERIPMMFAALAPHPLLLAIWMPALIGLTTRGRFVFITAVIAYLLLCMPYAIFLSHYVVGLLPAGAMLVGLGVQAFGRAFAGTRLSVEVLAALCCLGLSLMAIPKLNPLVGEKANRSDSLNMYLDTFLPANVKQPAVVLFRYRDWNEPFDPRWDSPYDEPVYTLDALWPEESAIARLQDLGAAKNQEVYDFFASREPSRNIYRFDRRSRQLTFLGTAAALAARGQSPSTRPSASATTLAVQVP